MPKSPHPEIITKTTFNFPDAMRALMEGHRVTKEEWGDERVFIALVDGRVKIALPENHFVPCDLIIGDGDLFGTDFYILK